MNEVGASLQYVRDAIASLPEELERALEVALPPIDFAPTHVVTTGIGGSEGPARVLAALLAEAGMAARFSPTSQLAAAHGQGGLLVMFSQGLSPNARLCLETAESFRARWLVTSVPLEGASPAKRSVLEYFVSSRFTPVVIPPREEPATLVRLIGPTIATLLAFRVAAALRDDRALALALRDAPAHYRRGARHAERLLAPLAIVTIGLATEYAYGHRWKLLEALLGGDPPVWEVLQFAHGPLQAFYERELTLLVLERGRGSPLFERLTRTLSPLRHRVLHLASERDDELCIFEHTARIDALLLNTLEAAPRNLFDWPARHGDGPLYGLGNGAEG